MGCATKSTDAACAAVRIALVAAAAFLGFAVRAELKVSAGSRGMAEEIDCAKCAGHSHLCRKPGVTDGFCRGRLLEWAAKHGVEAVGVGSPWTAANRAACHENELVDRDLYYAGRKDAETLMDRPGVCDMLADLNGRGCGALFYLDNETPKSFYGHLWYVGFAHLVASWHDYSQDRPCWYSPYDDATADRNALTGDYHRRRTYATVVAEQRAHGALAVWAHPTSWWTTDGTDDGPFVTNIAAEMIPQLLRDGYLDGLAVMGYDAYHPDYQNIWFAILDLGYRAPGFAEIDLSPAHGTDGKGDALFNLLPFPRRPLTLDYLKSEFRAARHTMSSGPKLFMKVDGRLQGAEIESWPGASHVVEAFAWPQPPERELSRVQLVGRGGKVLAEERHFAGGKITWRVEDDGAGGWVAVRAFGEHDWDYDEKRQQLTRQCAVTNPVWLRTNAFRAPDPIPAPDPMTIPEVRELEDFLAKGRFRFDPRAGGKLGPGMVPVWAFQIERFRAALLKAASCRQPCDADARHRTQQGGFQ